MAKVLVTGGNGYIGSHTVLELIEQGHHVHIVDSLVNSKRYVHQRLEAISGTEIPFSQFDLSDNKACREFFDQHNDFDACIHFAAHLFVEESVENPLKYYRNNLGSLFNAMEALLNSPSKPTLVFSSSCTVYGNPEKLPIAENEAVKEAQSPYGNTKRIGEEIIKDACKAYGLKAVSLRYFNPAGAHRSGQIGEDPIGNHTHLLPIIAEVVKGERQELKIFGNDYPTRDGTCVRDYIHIEDLANAHVKAMDFLNEMKPSEFELFNVGTGKGQTVKELHEAFQRVSGKTIPFSIVDRRPGDVDAVYADNKKIKSQLNWEAQRSLDEIVRSSLEWELKRPK